MTDYGKDNVIEDNTTENNATENNATENNATENDTIENVVIPIVKKKGRPRKHPIVEVQSDVPVEKKKRGRKRKEKVEETVKIKKKRGRKAAVKFFSSSIRKKIPLTTVIQDNDKFILHLDIKDDNQEGHDFKFGAVKGEYSGSDFKLVIDSNEHGITIDDDESGEESGEESGGKTQFQGETDELEEYIDNHEMEDPSNIIKLYEKRLEARLNQDTLLIERLESLHNDDSLIEKLTNKSDKKITEKISKNIENMRKGYFSLFESLYENHKWLESTDTACWWCCHQFKTVPIGLPIKYVHNKFIVKGTFCTFACLLGYYYNTTKKREVNIISLIKFMYKKLTGILNVPKQQDYKQMLESTLNDDMFDSKEIKDNYIDALVQMTTDKLEPAPPRCSLKIFGGELSIEEFRNSTNEHKIYKLIEFPLCISRDYIEAVDIQNLKNINLNVFTPSTRTSNILDDKKIEEAKIRIQASTKNNNVVTNNGIDKFIRF